MSTTPTRHASSSSHTDTPASASRRNSRACLECRLAKTKCLIAEGQDICERCSKFSFECKFVQHHRGRKPVSKLAAHQDAGGASDEEHHVGDTEAPEIPLSAQGKLRSVSASAPATSESPTRQFGQASSSAVRIGGDRTLKELDTQARRRIWEMLAQKIPQRGSTYTFVSKGEVAHDDLDNGTLSERRAHSRGAEHATAASSSTQHFASTFRNLVRPVDRRATHTTDDLARYPRLTATLTLNGSKDPIELGFLSLAAAKRLFDYFFLHINPWAMIFDPYLVSHDSLRASSCHLYTTVLFLASRYIEPIDANVTWDSSTTSMSRDLGSHARGLTVAAFATGDRRMETGVAIYLSSVWREADDNFAILYSSYAAKIMSDISTELLSLHAPASTMSPDPQHVRTRRHQQRQFLFHFIQEHTHLLHFAPRPNFDRGPSLLRNLLAWSDDVLATEDDVLLCADIDSVLLQTKYKSIMETAQSHELEHATGYRGGSECFLLLQSFLDELEGWRSRWEFQATKIDRRFSALRKGEQKSKTFPGRLSLQTRMSLLNIMRSSLVMQVSSIAFRASLRDINTSKAAALPSMRSLLSTLDDRAEQIYCICLDSALELLAHTAQMPPSVLRHAQDMIMVLAPHAALLATYLISLPLPSAPHSLEKQSQHGDVDHAKTRIRRRKAYERKSLDLMRETLECFRRAVVRPEDHVELCAQYFDSLLNVIEGEGDMAPKYAKRTHDALETQDDLHPVLAKRQPNTRGLTTSSLRDWSSSGKSATSDSLAAETLLGLHCEKQSFGHGTPLTTMPPSFERSFSASAGAPPSLHHVSHTPPSEFFDASTASGKLGGFAPSPSVYSINGSSMDYRPVAGEGWTGGEVGGTGASTPVDWTWLQSFLDVPEFTWM